MTKLRTLVPHKQQQDAEYTTLALPAIVEELEEEREHIVLDLGVAVGSNVDFFSQFSCKLYVADLFRALEARPVFSTEEEAPWKPIFEDLLPYEETTRFDLILAWDLINYLNRPQIDGLALRMSEFCHPGTTLFALVSTRRQIPARPQIYHIISPDRLLYRQTTQAVRPCPLYKEPEIRRRMGGFQVKSTYILRNGFQEYVLTYSAGPA